MHLRTDSRRLDQVFSAKEATGAGRFHIHLQNLRAFRQVSTQGPDLSRRDDALVLPAVEVRVDSRTRSFWEGADRRITKHQYACDGGEEAVGEGEQGSEESRPLKHSLGVISGDRGGI